MSFATACNVLPNTNRQAQTMLLPSHLNVQRAFLCCVCILLFATSPHSFGQEQEREPQSAPRRFKHEKRGAIVFATGEDYELKCDLYLPESDSPRPVMLAIHGGAWRTGTKFSMYRHARMLANRGYAVMAINYRLAPEHPWPAQIHDCKHAVRWIRKNAEQYNIDPDRIYAYGYSAGGHLAALLATTDSDDGLEGDVDAELQAFDSRIQGAIVGGSPLEFSWIEQDATTLNYWLGDTKAAAPEKYKEASPGNYVTADDPVTIVYHGSSDMLVPASTAKAFVSTCKEESVLAELLMSGSGHIGTFSDTTLFLKCLEKFEASLKRTATKKGDD